MTKSGKSGRKTKRVLRKPATKFGHLAKRLKKVPDKGTQRGQK